jgi:hypothetical protein
MTKKLDRKSITSEKSVTAVSTPHSNSKIITRKTKKIIKSKYPVFKSSGAKDDLPGDLVIVPSSGSSKIKMAEEYTNFLQNICDKEKAELHKMFEEIKAENQSSAHSLQAIEDQLYSILDALPPRFHEEYLKTPTDSLIFSPELNPVERSLAEFKQKQLEIYNQFYQTLLQYEQDLGVLRQTENLWLGKIPADLNVSEINCFVRKYSYFERYVLYRKIKRQLVMQLRIHRRDISEFYNQSNPRVTKFSTSATAQRNK